MVYYHDVGKIVSPSGKVYADLIVINEIDGKVVKEYARKETNINIKNKSTEYKKGILMLLFSLLSEIHAKGVIYGDTFYGNVLIDDCGSQVYLIDFDKSFYVNKVPEYFSEVIVSRPIISDIFCFQSLISSLFPTYILQDPKTMNFQDFLTVIDSLT